MIASFILGEVRIMKPKSGIAGDERNIAVLLFLYILQVFELFVDSLKTYTLILLA